MDGGSLHERGKTWIASVCMVDRIATRETRVIQLCVANADLPEEWSEKHIRRALLDQRQHLQRTLARTCGGKCCPSLKRSEDSALPWYNELA